MRLWIDDIRLPPDETWTWAKTSEEALAYLLDTEPTEISFDHDLGGDDTAMVVANWIEEQAYFNKIGPIVWYIHSANPVGRKRLCAALEQADAHWMAHALVVADSCT